MCRETGTAIKGVIKGETRFVLISTVFPPPVDTVELSPSLLGVCPLGIHAQIHSMQVGPRPRTPRASGDIHQRTGFPAWPEETISPLPTPAHPCLGKKGHSLLLASTVAFQRLNSTSLLHHPPPPPPPQPTAKQGRKS